MGNFVNSYRAFQSPVAGADKLLLESSDALLLEAGDNVLLE